MTGIVNMPITTAVSAVVSPPLQFRDGGLQGVAIQGNFVYGGSGWTSVDAWVQSSIDGLNWVDVAQFSFATTTARKVYNLSSLTPVTTAVVPGDGVLTANTSVDGIVGPLWRCKYTSVGVYGGGTTLRIDVNKGMTAQ